MGASSAKSAAHVSAGRQQGSVEDDRCTLSAKECHGRTGKAV